MKKQTILLLLTALLLSSCGSPTPLVPDYGPVDTYAVLAEKDNYKDVVMTDLLVDFIDIVRVRESLEALGWAGDNIHELQEFTAEDLRAELDWLEENADANDLVFFYVTAHGRYLSDVVNWKTFFPAEWEDVSAVNKVLVVDSCQAAQFTNQIQENSGLLIAAVDEDEYGWKGLEEEGLPIVGGIFTYYFTEALLDPAADSDGDGRVSIQEAALAGEAQQRDYMHEVVFAVPEFVDDYHQLGVEPEKDEGFPDVIIQDWLGTELFFDLKGE
jgi:hypothetical protein